ncbi:MAG TPA: MetQ/NlpA family ABC transporter substrate-binding protein [Coxiellaceae bacterium]|nr:MetQ/NlpA family ABC transporter substrate-binding protein [Coxiellaceae bacterium]
MIRAWKHWLIILGCISVLTACGNDNDLGVVRVGIIDGPSQQPISNAAAKFAKKNLRITIQSIVFANYNDINVALCEGKVDANVAESLPFLVRQVQTDPKLKAAMQANNCQLIPLTRTYTFPFGLFSRQLTSLSQLQPQSVVAIPAEAVNRSRALFLLQQAGLIQLQPNAQNFVTVNDIVSNPYQLIIVSIDVNRLPDTVAGAALVVMNSNYAALAGLSMQNALAVEQSINYATILVVRRDQAQNIKFAQLATAYHSPDAIKAAAKLSNNAAIESWGGNILGLSNTVLPSSLSESE